MKGEGSEDRTVRRVGWSCCGAQNFCAALRLSLKILTAATRSLRFLCHRQRSVRSPHRPAHGTPCSVSLRDRFSHRSWQSVTPVPNKGSPAQGSPPTHSTNRNKKGGIFHVHIRKHCVHPPANRSRRRQNRPQYTVQSKKALIQNLPILYQSLFQLVLYTQVTLFCSRFAFSSARSTQWILSAMVSRETPYSAAMFSMLRYSRR